MSATLHTSDATLTITEGQLEALAKSATEKPLSAEQLRIDGVIDPTKRIVTVAVSVELTASQAAEVFPLLAMGRKVRVTVEPLTGSFQSGVAVVARGEVDAVATKRKVDKDGFVEYVQTRGVKVAAPAGFGEVTVNGETVDAWAAVVSEPADDADGEE